MTNRKYPKPIKKNGRFYCPVEGCNVVLSGKEFMHHPFIDIGVVKQYIQRRS